MKRSLSSRSVAWASRHREGLALAAIGAAHRTIVFIWFHHVIDHLTGRLWDIAQIQLYPAAIYREHFVAAMWLLQKTPPLPHLVVKALLLLTSFPLGFTHSLFVLQSAISIATAVLLRAMIVRLTGGRVLGFGLALWFLLSTDLLILENDCFGQGFYENLGMLFVTVSCTAALRALPPIAATGAAAWAGLFAALAALTRSSLSYFAVVPLLVILQRPRPAKLAALLAPILLLQGGWALKNVAAYGYFAWETSSWAGYSAAKGLDADKQGAALCQHILASQPGTYPDWFVASVRACPFRSPTIPRLACRLGCRPRMHARRRAWAVWTRS